MKKLEEDYTGYEFTYFTYEEYDKMLDLMLFNLYKNTYVCKDDIKQDLMIFILKLEKKIKDKKIDNIDNVKGYIVHCLKMKTSNVCKKFFSDMIKNNFIDIVHMDTLSTLVRYPYLSPNYTIHSSY